ncbi:MAG TPA: glycosyltransferase [Gemmatimonadaceae bacterium]|nr:glycosyltransferase [Gemmatimonadaceae bacterium]
MRVCFYHAEPEWSGRARAFADAAVALRARGYEVTFVCERGSAVQRRLTVAGHDAIGIRTRGMWPGVAFRLGRVLRRNFSEAVFVHSEREQLQAAAAARFADRGAIVRRMPPFGSLTLGADARFAARIAATGFLFVFDADLRAARPPARALEPFVAPPAVVPVPMTPAIVRGDAARHIVCFFGVESRGAASVALRTAALLAERHREIRFTLLGPVDKREALKLQCAALGIVDRVELPLADATERSDRAAIAGADFGWVLSGGDDGMFAMLDCFAAGVPVVTEQNPLSGRLVRDGETGVLTGTIDPAESAAVFAGLLADPVRRDRLARGAIKAAAAWPFDAMTDGFVRAITAARDRTRWRG